jgi:hypothetical protein
VKDCGTRNKILAKPKFQAAVVIKTIRASIPMISDYSGSQRSGPEQIESIRKT